MSDGAPKAIEPETATALAPAELAVRCPTCASKRGEKCASLITALYRDEVHAARRELANKISEVP